jgi:C-terminal processing protease CtpA/Prc
MLVYVAVKRHTDDVIFFLDAIAGIFIRDIADDSVCSRDGRLAIGDQIIEVNEQSLNGFSNVQALYVLQNTTSSVRLKVRRYLDGAKHDKIKEMISKGFFVERFLRKLIF